MIKTTTKILLIACIFFSCANAQKSTTQNYGISGEPWKLIALAVSQSSWKTELVNSAAYILLDEESKKFSGNTSCNVVNGTYKLGEENRIDFHIIAHTKRGCGNMQDLEKEYLDALENTESYTFDKDTLLFLNRENVAIATWIRGQDD